jgi:hypothetical protein
MIIFTQTFFKTLTIEKNCALAISQKDFFETDTYKIFIKVSL